MFVLLHGCIIPLSKMARTQLTIKQHRLLKHLLNETYTPKMITIRTLILNSFLHNMILVHQIDVTSAYLNIKITNFTCNSQDRKFHEERNYANLINHCMDYNWNE